MDKPLQPDTAIASWRQWRGSLESKPEVVSQLHGGYMNQSFLLESSGTRMVLRLNNKDALLPGAGRAAEARIWQVTSARGIAPPVVHIDADGGFLVSTFIEGTLPPKPQTNDVVLDQVFELMARCHSLELDVPALDYARHIDYYWEIIKNSGNTPASTLLRQRGPMQELLESLHNKGAQTGLCHHDPLPANFVGTPEKLYLIDWEYAAPGFVVMDYAALAVEWGIEDDVVAARSGIEPEMLAEGKALYRYLCALWKEANPG